MTPAPFLDRALGRHTLTTGHVRLVAFHDEPFLGLAYHAGPALTRVVHALDPARIDEFTADFAANPQLQRHPFFQGLRNALRREAWDACEAWYGWLQQGGNDAEFSLRYLSAHAYGRLVPHKRRRPAESLLRKTLLTASSPLAERAVSRRHRRGTPAPDTHAAACANPRALLLEKLWVVVRDYSWKSPLRFGILEAIALALARQYGPNGQAARALYFVDETLREPTLSIHLKTARQALHLRNTGSVVPPWLEKFAGPDNGYLRDYVCEIPFRRFDIVETGEVNLCCGHLLPKAIGRIESGPLDVTLNSGAALAIRRSVTDGSYKYCNHLECALLAQGTLPRREALAEPQARRAIESGDFSVTHADHLLFSYDQSCNLACPSCRRERIVEKPSENEAKAAVVEQTLLPVLPRLKHLEINVAGEVFVSKPSRRILAMITPQACPDLQVDLISNGILFTETEWNRFPGIHGKVSGVRISIDAARKPTFELLRRFAIHEVLLDNLAFLKRLREAGQIRSLGFSFTYQRDNLREMEEFVGFARGHGADKVIFEPLQNVGAFTAAEYTERAVHKSDHPLFADFLEMISRPVFAQAGIQHDFAGYDYARYRKRDLFLSQPFVPDAGNAGAEGLVATAGGAGTAWIATPSRQRHRLLVQDRFEYRGTYRFSAQVLPLQARHIGIEMLSLDQAAYGRVLFDVAAGVKVEARSVPGSLDNAGIKPMPGGWLELSFTFRVPQPSGIALNLYLADADGEAEFAGDGRCGFVAGPVSARPA